MAKFYGSSVWILLKKLTSIIVQTSSLLTEREKDSTLTTNSEPPIQRSFLIE